MLSLVVDGPKSDLATIKENYGEMTAHVAKEFLTRFHNTDKEQNSNAFSIAIDYKLILTKSEKDSDLSLGLGANGNSAIIIRETRDPDITHPYYQGSAIERINALQKYIALTTYSFTAIVKKNNIQNTKRSDMHYMIDDRHRYSEKFIQWVIKNLKQPHWLEDCVSFYKASRKKK